MNIILGVWLALDGLFSLILVYDKYWLWQYARVLRVLIGIYVALI